MSCSCFRAWHPDPLLFLKRKSQLLNILYHAIIKRTILSSKERFTIAQRKPASIRRGKHFNSNTRAKTFESDGGIISPARRALSASGIIECAWHWSYPGQSPWPWWTWTVTGWRADTSLACTTVGPPAPPAQARAGPQPAAARRSRVNFKLISWDIYLRYLLDIYHLSFGYPIVIYYISEHRQRYPNVRIFLKENSR